MGVHYLSQNSSVLRTVGHSGNMLSIYNSLDSKKKKKTTLRELILARTYFGEFGGLVEFSFQFRLVMWPSAKLSSINVNLYKLD